MTIHIYNINFVKYNASNYNQLDFTAKNILLQFHQSQSQPFLLIKYLANVPALSCRKV